LLSLDRIKPIGQL